jgi:hypothetical protein
MVNAPETSSSKSSSSALIPQVKGDVRNRSGIAHYTQHWDKNSAKDTAENTEARKEVYTDVVNGYYDVRSAFLPFSSFRRPCDGREGCFRCPFPFRLAPEVLD